jgi:hypothetical protein
MYKDNTETPVGGLKLLRMGKISKQDTRRDFSDDDYGIQIQQRVSEGYNDVLRASDEGFYTHSMQAEDIDVKSGTLGDLEVTGTISGDKWGITKKHMWGGANSYNNASVKFDFDNGEIFYGAMTQVIYSFRELENISSIGNLANNNITIKESGKDQGTRYSTSSAFSDVMQARYFHRHGFNNILVSGRINNNDSKSKKNGGSSTGRQHQYEIQVIIENSSGTDKITSSKKGTWNSGDDETFETKINLGSSLDDDTFYMVKIRLKSHIRFRYKGTNGEGSPNPSQARYTNNQSLKEDIKIISTT